jgi:hypothetical protein
MKITRTMLRRIIKETLGETISETISSVPAVLNSTTEGLQASLNDAIADGTLRSDTTYSDLLRFYQIMYQSQINHKDSYKYIHDQLEAGKISKPITRVMINTMYDSLGLTPMTSEDWTSFNEIMY